MAKIYAILVCEKLEKDKTGFPDIGDERLVGYYNDFNTAEKIVCANAADINETCYNYAIIEGVEPGLYQCATYKDRTIYKFNCDNKTYERINHPKFLQKIAGMTIG